MGQLLPGAPKASHVCTKHSLTDAERSFCATRLRRRHISRLRHGRRLCSPRTSAASRPINLRDYFRYCRATSATEQRDSSRSFLAQTTRQPSRNTTPFGQRRPSGARRAAGLRRAWRCPFSHNPPVDIYLNSAPSLHVLVCADRKACLYMAVGLLEVCGVLSPH